MEQLHDVLFHICVDRNGRWCLRGSKVYFVLYCVCALPYVSYTPHSTFPIEHFVSFLGFSLYRLSWFSSHVSFTTRGYGRVWNSFSFTNIVIWNCYCKINTVFLKLYSHLLIVWTIRIICDKYCTILMRKSFHLLNEDKKFSLFSIIEFSNRKVGTKVFKYGA